MINIQLDATGSLSVKWPRKDADILALGTAYLAYESSLPGGQQRQDVSLAVIQPVYDEAVAAVAGATGGESSRAIAAETLRQNYESARPQLEVAINQLKAKYYANLAQLEQWGLDTVAGSSGISVRKPRNQTAWIIFLQAYVTQEASLDPADQLTVPVLADLQTLNTAIQAAIATRDTARTTRETNVQGRGTAVQRLLDLLQVACATIVAVQYAGVVTNNLQRWGFTVQARTTGSNGHGEPPPEEPPV